MREVEVEISTQPPPGLALQDEEATHSSHRPDAAPYRRTKAAVAARAAGCCGASQLPERTKAAAAAAAAAAAGGASPSRKENAWGQSGGGGGGAPLLAGGMCSAGSCPNQAAARHPRLPAGLCQIHAARTAQLLAEGWPKGEDRPPRSETRVLVSPRAPEWRRILSRVQPYPAASTALAALVFTRCAERTAQCRPPAPSLASGST